LLLKSGPQRRGSHVIFTHAVYVLQLTHFDKSVLWQQGFFGASQQLIPSL
jgi:hypothetical protein